MRIIFVVLGVCLTVATAKTLGTADSLAQLKSALQSLNQKLKKNAAEEKLKEKRVLVKSDVKQSSQILSKTLKDIAELKKVQHGKDWMDELFGDLEGSGSGEDYGSGDYPSTELSEGNEESSSDGAESGDGSGGDGGSGDYGGSSGSDGEGGSGSCTGWKDSKCPELESCQSKNVLDTGYSGSGSSTPPNTGECGQASAKSRLKSLLNEIQGILNKGKATPDARIIGGQEGALSQFPWLVAVGSASGGPDCGGSLITDEWVLTAAHCFRNNEAKACETIVRIGEFDLDSGVEKHVDIPAELVISHPDYDDSLDSTPNDIALVKLKTKAPLSKEHINALCLPATTQSFNGQSDCKVAGWGDQKFDAGDYSNKIKWITMPLLDLQTDCKNYIDQFDGQFSDAMHLCAGYSDGSKDTCSGDSGGPLFCRNSDSDPYVQVGIVSFGYKCAEPGWPGVYTNVKTYVPWINDVMDRN